MATEFNYTREWTDAEAFPLLSFTKNWENPEDYPTYEPDEMQVRRDMQSLHDEVKDFLNNELIPRVIAEDATVEGWEAQETARSEAESARSEAETARADAEQGRVDAEAARVQTEAARVETEAARATAEQARGTAEVARTETEAARATAEQNRATVESARVTAEAARAAAESARVTTEANRESAESGRAAAEAARANAETARNDAESKRVAAEQERASAEKARVDAESSRAREFATLKTNVEAATNSANTAADKVNKMTVSATDLTPGSAATVTKGTNSNGGIDLKFGIPEGAQGKTGNGIKSINKTGGTGAAGTYDTYTITMTDGSTFNFRVLNGANGKDGDGTGDMVADTYDPQGKRTDIFAYIEEHGGVQSDWNQNDPEAKDYVKNRFGGYYAESFETIFEDTECAFAFTDSDYLLSAENFYMTDLVQHGFNANNIGYNQGHIRISVDGVSYDRVYDNSYGFAPNDEIPVGFHYDPLDGRVLVYTFEAGETRTVKIEMVRKNPVIIPKEFLFTPDWESGEDEPGYIENRPFYTERWMSTVYNIEDEAVVDFEITCVDGVGTMPYFEIYEDAVYVILFDNDGYEHRRTAYVDENGTPTIGEGAGSYYGPFMIQQGKYQYDDETTAETFGDNTLYIYDSDGNPETGTTVHTLSVYKYREHVEQIDEKYIPDTVATKADIEAAIGNAIGGSY